MRLAQEDLATIENQIRTEELARVHAQQVQVEAQAGALVAQAVMTIQTNLASAAKVEVPIVELPVEPIVALLLAREHFAAYQDGQRELEVLKANLGDLEDRRQSIVTRRSEGKCEPRDPQTLAVLDADLKGLRALIARKVAAMPPAPDHAPVAALEAAWAAHQTQACQERPCSRLRSATKPLCWPEPRG